MTEPRATFTGTADRTTRDVAPRKQGRTGGGTRRPPSRIDWGSAFAFFVALGQTERTLQRVADEYPISYARVKQVARRDDWWARAHAIDAENDRKVELRAIRSLEERNRDTIRVVDKARAKYLGALETGEHVPNGRDLAALLRIEQLIEGEATDRVEIREVRELVVRLLADIDAGLRVILDGELDNGKRAHVLGRFRETVRQAVEATSIGAGAAS